MSDDETVEVPVTRRARVTLIGVYDSPAMYSLRRGDQVVLRAHRSGTFRAGIATIVRGWVLEDLRHGIPAASSGDLVYRVEPE